jgi:hypothetical protein
MYELVFLFTGLCGFALNGPIDQSHAVGLDVVLVAADDHAPTLVVQESAIDNRSDLKCGARPVPGFCAFDLRGQIVSVQNGDPDSRPVAWTPLADSFPDRPRCPTKDDGGTDGNEHSYGWLVPMGWLTPHRGHMRADFSRPSRTMPDHFAAEVRLERGDLSNQGFSSDRKGIIIWNFGRGFWRRRVKTALGDPVELRQSGWDKPVVLEFRDVRTDLVKTLTLKSAASGGERLVEIYNTPEYDVCPDLTATASAAASLTDNHFEHMYDLLDKPVRSNPRAAGRCSYKTRDQEPLNRVIEGSCSQARLIESGTAGNAESLSNPQCPGSDQSGP